MQYTIKYDISARANGKSDHFSGEIPFTLDSTNTSTAGFELHQLGEKVDRNLATSEDRLRIQELVAIVMSEANDENEIDFDRVVDTVMLSLRDKGVHDSDPGDEGWYVSRSDLSVRVVNSTIVVEGAASWG